MPGHYRSLAAPANTPFFYYFTGVGTLAFMIRMIGALINGG